MDKLYAFWKYDLFPYLLGGEIESFKEGGRVYVPSYQASFRPVLILQGPEGQELQRRLHNLGSQFVSAQNALKLEYEAKRALLLDRYPQLKGK